MESGILSQDVGRILGPRDFIPHWHHRYSYNNPPPYGTPAGVTPKLLPVGELATPFASGISSVIHLNLEMPKEREEANARERNRNYSVNSAFMMLRTLIPTEPPDRKLSKIETLRLACSYISHLGSILLKGSCEISTTGATSKGLAFAQRSQICTFCLTSAKLKP